MLLPYPKPDGKYLGMDREAGVVRGVGRKFVRAVYNNARELIWNQELQTREEGREALRAFDFVGSIAAVRAIPQEG